MLLALIATSVLAWRATAKTCSPLKNRDIFSTVEVKVGTPPQRFELVADTGSNTLIVQSCICQDLGACPSTFGRCFRGNSTSTFSIARDASNDSATHPEVWILKYGSGDIEALVSSDVVSLGSYSVRMNSSLLLMVSQALKFDSSFEGILGLGVPNLTVNTGPHGGTHRPQMLTSFLEEAKVKRFSLCFNSGADGVLALDYAAPAKLLPSVFHEHWQLRLRGASVAGHALSMAQDSPAYAIPDSGTTLVTGPQEQITSLMEFICSEWPRCKQAKQDLTLSMAQVKTFSNRSFSGITRLSRKDRLLAAHAKWHGSGEMSQSGASFTASGAYALQMLLEDCNNWKKGIDLNAEMPSIKLQLEGADGTQQEVELLPSSYVAEVTSNAMVWTQKYLLGILPYWWPELEEDSSCATLLGAADYVGHQVWILGTPLFYNRRVYFDLGHPPKMGFSEEPCGSCASGDYHTGDLALIQGVNANVAMRQLSSPGRVPWPKVSEPLGPLDVPI